MGCGGTEFNGGDVDVTQILATAAEADFVNTRRLYIPVEDGWGVVVPNLMAVMLMLHRSLRQQQKLTLSTLGDCTYL